MHWTSHSCSHYHGSIINMFSALMYPRLTTISLLLRFERSITLLEEHSTVLWYNANQILKGVRCGLDLTVGIITVEVCFEQVSAQLSRWCLWVFWRPNIHKQRGGMDFFFSYIKLNSPLSCFHMNYSIEKPINWSIKETWKLDGAPVQTAGWFNGCTIHPVFELAAYSFHTKLGYYPPDWLVTRLFSLVLMHWYPS